MEKIYSLLNTMNNNLLEFNNFKKDYLRLSMKKSIITSLAITGILTFCGCSIKTDPIKYSKPIFVNDLKPIQVVVNKTCEEGTIERQIVTRSSNSSSAYLYICKNYNQPESYTVTIKEINKDGLPYSESRTLSLQDNLNSNKNEYIVGRVVSLSKENDSIIVNIEE